MQLNINEIREALTEQLRAIRNGSPDLKASKEIRGISNEYCKTIKLEMAYYKDIGKKPELGAFLPPPENKEPEASKS